MFSFQAVGGSEARIDDVSRFVKVWEDDTTVIAQNTSGSTGEPKKIELSKAAMEASAMRTNKFFGLGEHSKVLHTLPVKFIGGKMIIVRGKVGSYRIDIGPSSLNPELNIDLAERYDLVSLTPAQVDSLDGPSLSNFRQVLLGGAPLSKRLEQRLSRTSAQIFIGYGMTETCSHVAIRKVGDPMFEAMEGVSFEQAEDGCLVINDTATGISALKTNDHINLTDKRHFEWLGRSDNVINSGGLKVNPESLENLLSQDISVSFFIGGVPDDRLGERLVLFTEGVVENLSFDVIGDSKQRPKEIVKTTFLRTPNGKIKRKATVQAYLSERLDT